MLIPRLSLLLLLASTPAFAGSLTFSGVLGNSGEQGTALVKFGLTPAHGMGVVYDKYGTLWDRGGDTVLNRYRARRPPCCDLSDPQARPRRRCDHAGRRSGHPVAEPKALLAVGRCPLGYGTGRIVDWRRSNFAQPVGRKAGDGSRWQFAPAQPGGQDRVARLFHSAHERAWRRISARRGGRRAGR